MRERKLKTQWTVKRVKERGGTRGPKLRAAMRIGRVRSKKARYQYDQGHDTR